MKSRRAKFLNAKSLRAVAACCGVAMLPLWPASGFAQSGTPEEVVVTGRLPGPPLWRVANGERVLWIFAYVSPIPKNMQWESARVEGVLSRADAYLPAPDVDVTVSKLVMFNPINIFRGMRLAKRLSRNEDNQTLETVLPPELYQRYAAVKDRYFPTEKEFEQQRPFIAGQNLAQRVISREDLDSPSDILRRIDRLARKQRGIERFDTEVKMKIEGGYGSLAERAETLVDGITPEQELACFEWQLGRIETDLDAMKSRANSWALGYVDEFLDAPLRRGDDDPCFGLLLASSETETITELLQRSQDEWLASAEKALTEHDTTLAVLNIREMFNANGLLARLKQKGYSVQEPN